MGLVGRIGAAAIAERGRGKGAGGSGASRFRGSTGGGIAPRDVRELP